MFWDNVKAELDFQGLLVKELSQKSGLNFNSLCNGMSRKTTPSVEVAYKIAQALNVSVEYLYSGNNYSGLNDDELAVIIRYRHLKEENRKVIKHLLNELS